MATKSMCPNPDCPSRAKTNLTGARFESFTQTVGIKPPVVVRCADCGWVVGGLDYDTAAGTVGGMVLKALTPTFRDLTKRLKDIEGDIADLDTLVRRSGK